MTSSEQSIISSLECQLAQKERELAGLREAMRKLPEFSRLDGDVCFKVPEHVSEGEEAEAEDKVAPVMPVASAPAVQPKKSFRQMVRKASSAVLMPTYQPQTVTSNRYNFSASIFSQK